ncbi:MAG TPA: glycosyltransferase family 87 protein [Gammaproteobacteria bacterium]|nr:glycosyltransferase family 87 protein [Gammaproteobacteria bacterium]
MSLTRLSVSLFSLGIIFFTLVVYFKRTLISSESHGLTDFYKFYESVLFYFSGQDLYNNTFAAIVTPVISVWVRSDGNLSTPFFTLLLLSLHYFNYARAFQLWNAISVACIFLGGWLALRPFPQWHKNTLPIIALFALYLPNSQNLACGEIGAMLLVIVAGAWLLARKNHDISAGMLIGFACAIKLFCGLFLIYFLCLKRMRLLLAALIVFILAFLLGGFVFGFNSYFSYHVILSSIYWYGITWNVSFHGFFLRLFSNVEGNTPLILAPYLANIFTTGCSVVLMGTLIWIWKKGGDQKFDTGFSLVIISMLLLSPLGWVYYFPLLLIPYLVLVEEGNMGTHLAACFLLWLSTLTGNFLRPAQIKTLTQIFVAGGVGFYVLLGLLGLLSLVAFGVKRSEQDTISESLWYVIYIVIFIPSLISLGAIFRGIMACH